MRIQSLRSGTRAGWLALTAACLGLLIATSPRAAAAQSTRGKVVLYAGFGAELIQYDVDVERAALTRRASVVLPANVQEAWRHPSQPVLYVAWSDRPPGTGVPGGSRHGLTALTIDVESGALRPHGAPATLASRAIHLTVDARGEHVLVAYNEPAGLTVHRLRADGTIGAAVEPAAPLDLGIYPHHVRVDPSNTSVFVISRGNNPTATRPEEPGSIRVLSYANGVVANRQTVAPGGGFGFQVRHADFHPTRPWVYVTLERQNQLQMYRRNADGTLNDTPSFSKETLGDPARVRPGQTTSTIRVHPGGRFVYLGNRAAGTVETGGQAVFAGGENSIAVFAIDQTTGEPTLIQNAETRGFTPRTFALDPGGRLLVVANQIALAVRDGGAVKTVPAGLSVFRIRRDGKLDFVNTIDFEARGDTALFWTGMVALP